MVENIRNIVLVDDHVVVRSGLRELIEKLGPYKIVYEFDDGQDLLDAMPFERRVDLIILDVNMPGLSGDGVMEVLRSKKNKIPVLVLSLNRSESMIIKLFRMGVRGYLPKNITAAELKKALEQVFENGFYHNEFLVMSLQKEHGAAPANEQEEVLERLSQKEKEFLKHVCNDQEYTYEQIAELMGVHARTIENYRKEIFDKFGIKSKTGLVLFVLKYNLFERLVEE
jgi:DNA-binding NarL/FixJ family response regulator